MQGGRVACTGMTRPPPGSISDFGRNGRDWRPCDVDVVRAGSRQTCWKSGDDRHPDRSDDHPGSRPNPPDPVAPSPRRLPSRLVRVRASMGHSWPDAKSSSRHGRRTATSRLWSRWFWKRLLCNGSKKILTVKPIAGDDKGNHAPQCCAEHITIAERVPPSRQIGQNAP